MFKCVMVGKLAVRLAGGQDKFLACGMIEGWRLPTPTELEGILKDSAWWARTTVLWGFSPEDRYWFWTSNISLIGMELLVEVLSLEDGRILGAQMNHYYHIGMRHILVCEAHTLRGAWEIY